MNFVLIKLDENLSRSHVEFLRLHGHTVDGLVDQGMGGATDNVVWAHVQAAGRFFVTLDLDFSDVRRFPPGSHEGILLIRAVNQSRDAIQGVLERVLRETPLESLHACLAVADAVSTRIRRPPDVTIT